MAFGDTYALIVNKIGKKEYFVDGHWHFETESPRLYPYTTKQEKQDVLDHARRTGILDDAGDILIYQLTLNMGTTKTQLVTTITRKDSLEFKRKLDGEELKRGTYDDPKPSKTEKKPSTKELNTKKPLTVEAIIPQSEMTKKSENDLDFSLFSD